MIIYLSKKELDEEDIFTAIIMWIKKDPQQRKKYLQSLMEMLDFNALSFEFLKESVLQEVRICGRLLCKHYETHF